MYPHRRGLSRVIVTHTPIESLGWSIDNFAGQVGISNEVHVRERATLSGIEKVVLIMVNSFFLVWRDPGVSLKGRISA